jgi:formate dehydrogenase (coenzyme F420) beta subunit
MTSTIKIEVKEKNLPASLGQFLKSILEREEISAMLVPRHLPMKNSVMPMLVTDPELMDGADPLAPSFPTNAAKLVSRLTRKPSGSTVAVVLRPCEIRAFVELVKLKQGSYDDLMIIGMDCPGAMGNRDYADFAGKDADESTLMFCRHVFSGEDLPGRGVEMTPACRACEHPVPHGADINLEFFGIDTDHQFLVRPVSSAGKALLQALSLPETETPPEREKIVSELIQNRKEFRDSMFAETDEAVNSMEKLDSYLAHCVNCYNCRVACPVCYCKECVFSTDVFTHEPSQYVMWAQRKGVIKMPTDTLFYHLTRLAHMSTACVGCGQCSNACPNDIPVMELFRTISHATQNAFGYEAGRDPDEKPPLSEFKEEEFSEVVGLT